MSTDYSKGAPDPYGFNFVVQMKDGFKEANRLLGTLHGVALQASS
jgi:hypothetical protein